jgi:hypothetical protein
MMQGSGNGGIVSALTGGSNSYCPLSCFALQFPSMSHLLGGQWNNNQNAGNQSGLPTNSNTLSYGSLKNRFLSGTNKTNGVAASGNGVGATSAGMNANNNLGGNNTGASSGKSKLFSLAR